MAHRREWAIPIISNVTPWDLALLGTLYVGLNYLSVDPVRYKVLKHPLPFKEGLVPLKKSEKKQDLSELSK